VRRPNAGDELSVTHSPPLPKVMPTAMYAGKAGAILSIVGLVTGCMNAAPDRSDASDVVDAGNHPTVDAGSDAGALADGGTDAGPGVCDWRGEPDAGVCTENSECPGGYYCDFFVSHCLSDAGTEPWIGSLVPGSCLQNCEVNNFMTPCSSGEDCGDELICVLYPGGQYNNYLDFCTIQQPCQGAVCFFPSCPPPDVGCPTGCAPVQVPHSCDFSCICPDVVCDGGL